MQTMRMFIGRITMKIFVLYKTSELTKFGKIAAQKIDSMHHAENPRDFAFPREDRLKDFPRLLRVLKTRVTCPSDRLINVRQVRAQIQMMFLGKLKTRIICVGCLRKRSRRSG